MLTQVLRDLIPHQAVAFNLHLTGHCDMACRGCYARFGTANGSGYGSAALTRREWYRIIERLDRETAAFPRRKINFVGGEPLLIRYLPDLLARARNLGFTTSIVTNGFLLHRRLEAVAPHTDWIGISVDSFQAETLQRIGRQVRGRTVDYPALGRAIRAQGVRLKVNTVVSRENHTEDLRGGLQALMPDRWKVFRFLVIRGENDHAADLAVSEDEFREFVVRHESLAPIVEDNHQMRGSYLMIGPDGNLLDNSAGAYRPVVNLLTRGGTVPPEAPGFAPRRFLERGGIYDW